MNVFITGGSRGIGCALAKEYAHRGDRLFLVARDEERLKIITEEINTAGGKSFFQKCDVSNFSDVQNAVKRATELLGSIDLAILNSGTGGSGRFDDFDLDTFRNVFEVNLFGIVYGIACLEPMMKSQGKGIIAGVGSLAEFRGYPSHGAYSASKIAAAHILETARMELKPEGIKVVTIKPGFVRTDMTAKNKFPMPFIMEPEKAAKIIVRGIEKGKSVISFPLIVSLFSTIAKIIPASLYEKFASKPIARSEK